jgi:NADPH:quinone reductase-like Zn-dependent oxidoreductase
MFRRGRILGVDFAGTVEAVGEDVTLFKAGDAVFGGRSGALAEYVVIREDRALALKPENISFAEAAAVPVAAITALQAVRDKAAVRPGQDVLVNGASGGVGNHPLLALRRVLEPEGVVVMVGGSSDDPWIGPLLGPIGAAVLSPFVSQRFAGLLAELNPEDLRVLGELLAAGSMKSVIDRDYPLREVPAAIAYLEEGRARGKVVIDVP